MSRNFFKAGIIQFDVRLGHIRANIDAVLEGMAYLGRQRAKMAVLPEMWSCSFDNPHLSEYAKETPAILERLSYKAYEYDMMIAGSLPEAVGKDIFNTMYLIDRNGTVAGSYRKVHLFPLTGEPEHFCAGNQNMVCETSVGPVGLMICYDLRFPELCRSLALKGARMVIVSAQWPLVRVGHWDALVRARAIENQLFMVAVNRCGNENGLEFGGRSQIVSPQGNILAKAGTETRTLYAELDFHEIETYRNQIPCLKERVPHAYTL